IEDARRRVVVHGRHDHARAGAAPLAHEGEDLVRGVQLAVDQHRVGARAVVGLGALQRLGEAPAGDEGLDARDDAEVRVRLRVLGGADLARELLDPRERLCLAADEGVRLREELVLDAHRRDAAALELAHEPAHVVEVPVARVGVEQQRHARRVGHELDRLEHLRPARLVVVAQPHRGGDREPAAPESLEAGLLGDPRRETAVGLHQELDLRRAQELLESGGLLHASLERRSAGPGSRSSSSAAPAAPPAKDSIVSTIRSPISRCESWVLAPLWGVSTTCSSPASGETCPSPSRSCTSRPARARWPVASAWWSARSSTTPPRARFTRKAPRFMRASAAASIRLRVESWSGTWRLTKSERRSTSSSVVRRMPSAASRSNSLRPPFSVQPSTRMSHATPSWPTFEPMLPAPTTPSVLLWSR